MCGGATSAATLLALSSATQSLSQPSRQNNSLFILFLFLTGNHIMLDNCVIQFSFLSSPRLVFIRQYAPRQGSKWIEMNDREHFRKSDLRITGPFLTFLALGVSGK